MNASGLPVTAPVDALPAAPTLWVVTDARAAQSARSHVRDQLTEWGTDQQTIDDALLLVSELTVNVAQHSTSRSVGITVAAIDDRVAIGVREQAASELTGPHDHVLLDFTADEPPTAPPTKVRGRGLKILDALASEWGISRTHRSTSTWFSLTPEARPGLRVEPAVAVETSTVQAATEQLEFLKAVTDGLASATSAHQIGDVITHQLRHHVDAVFIALLEPGGNTMRYLSRDPMPAATDVRGGASGPRGDIFPLSAAAFCDEPIFIDVPEHPNTYPWKAEHVAVSGTHAEAHLPLIVDGQTVGTLGVAWDHPRNLNADTRAVLTILAGVCAQALDRVHATRASATTPSPDSTALRR